jgi:hypothetical protein
LFFGGSKADAAVTGPGIARSKKSEGTRSRKSNAA